MLFNTLSYGIFIPVVFIVYWSLPQSLKWAGLLAVSWWFCAQIDWKAWIVLLIMTAVSWAVGIWIENGRQGAPRKRRFAAGTFLMLAPLLLLKYAPFFIRNLNRLGRLLKMGEGGALFSVPAFFVPIGISFYTLQILGYLIDVYRGKIQAERHPGYYALFAGFFPQLVSGPIGRAEQLLPQYRQKVDFRQTDFGHALKLMAWGYFKKLCIADVFAVTVDKVFASPEIYVGLIFPVVTVMYTIELYCDFSGYSDIAVGTAELFGIRLQQNFRSPYYSRSVREFWSRWHISLSGWFRDYVYIPLGGSRCGKARRILNLMITMLISGLWHGAAWTYIFWGGLHGIYQSLEALCGRGKPAKISGKTPEKTPAKIFAVVLTFIQVSFAWLFFRAGSMSTAWRFIRYSVFGISDFVNYLKTFVICVGIPYLDMVWISIPVVILAAADFLAREEDIAVVSSRWKPWVRYPLYVLLLAAILIFSQKGVQTEFIYGTF